MHKEWTEGRRKAFIISLLRSGSRRWPPKYETLADSYTEHKTNEKTGRLAKHYKCNKCKKDFPGKEVEVDHIIPIVSSKGFTTYDDFINALFCTKENLQTLCKTCHLEKTKQEKKIKK
jgi:5-methylcytosine-specific restriction endonuclease McrA